MARFYLLVLLGLVAVPALAAGQSHKPPPWHLVDLWWDIGEDRPFESYSIDVAISEEAIVGKPVGRSERRVRLMPTGKKNDNPSISDQK